MNPAFSKVFNLQVNVVSFLVHLSPLAENSFQKNCKTLAQNITQIYSDFLFVFKQKRNRIISKAYISQRNIGIQLISRNSLGDCEKSKLALSVCCAYPETVRITSKACLRRQYGFRLSNLKITNLGFHSTLISHSTSLFFVFFCCCCLIRLPDLWSGAVLLFLYTVIIILRGCEIVSTVQNKFQVLLNQFEITNFTKILIQQGT